MRPSLETEYRHEMRDLAIEWLQEKFPGATFQELGAPGRPKGSFFQVSHKGEGTFNVAIRTFGERSIAIRRLGERNYRSVSDAKYVLVCTFDNDKRPAAYHLYLFKAKDVVDSLEEAYHARKAAGGKSVNSTFPIWIALDDVSGRKATVAAGGNLQAKKLDHKSIPMPLNAPVQAGAEEPGDWRRRPNAGSPEADYR